MREVPQEGKKKPKEVYHGTVMVALRFAEGERDYTYLVTKLNLAEMDALKKYEYEGDTGGGIPIFQSKAYRQLELSEAA